MPNYSLNNSVPEPDRTLEDKGFHGMHHETSPDVAYQYPDPLPAMSPSRLVNKVDTSSDTDKDSLPTPSGDFARRTS